MAGEKLYSYAKIARKINWPQSLVRYAILHPESATAKRLHDELGENGLEPYEKILKRRLKTQFAVTMPTEEFMQFKEIVGTQGGVSRTVRMLIRSFIKSCKPEM